MAEAILPAGWPEGGSLAVAVSIMLEGWTDDSAPGIGPMGNPLKPGVQDLQARSLGRIRPQNRRIAACSTCSARPDCAPSGTLAASSPSAIPN